MPRMSKAKRLIRIRKDLRLLMDGTNCLPAKAMYPTLRNCELCDADHCEFATSQEFNGYHCLVVIAEDAVCELIERDVIQ